MLDFEALAKSQQTEISTLRERIKQLEFAMLMENLVIHPEWGLTGSEGRVFAFLASRDMATKPQIHAALYDLRPDGDAEVEIKIVDVFICKMRKKLKPYGVEIKTLWGVGYALHDRARFAPQKEAA